MNESTAEWVAVVIGVALIVTYSIVMMATDGDAGWAWMLLVAGIATLVGGAGLLRRRGPSRRTTSASADRIGEADS